MAKNPILSIFPKDSNFSHHHDNDYDLELRNRETIKSNAERQAAQQLENAKVGGNSKMEKCIWRVKIEGQNGPNLKLKKAKLG